MNDAIVTGPLRERRPPATSLYVSVSDEDLGAIVRLVTGRGGDA